MTSRYGAEASRQQHLGLASVDYCRAEKIGRHGAGEIDQARIR